MRSGAHGRAGALVVSPQAAPLTASNALGFPVLTQLRRIANEPPREAPRICSSPTFKLGSNWAPQSISVEELVEIRCSIVRRPRTSADLLLVCSGLPRYISRRALARERPAPSRSPDCADEHVDDGYSGRQRGDQVLGRRVPALDVSACARSGIRTRTGLPPRDFKSLVSTSFTIRAAQRTEDRGLRTSLLSVFCRLSSELEAGVGIEPASTALQAAA